MPENALAEEPTSVRIMSWTLAVVFLFPFSLSVLTVQPRGAGGCRSVGRPGIRSPSPCAGLHDT